MLLRSCDSGSIGELYRPTAKAASGKENHVQHTNPNSGGRKISKQVWIGPGALPQFAGQAVLWIDADGVLRINRTVAHGGTVGGNSDYMLMPGNVTFQFDGTNLN
jgi:hypothetical protein